MDDDNILVGALNQLGQTVKKTAQQVVKIPQEVGGDLGGQIGGVKQSERKPAASAPLSGASDEPRQWQSDEERIKFLRGLYGKSDMPQDGKKPAEFEEEIKDKTPEEQKELMELRNQLHKENYYDPTFNRPQKQEERPAEKVENEKKQEMQELQQKKAEKPPPLAVVRERNKAEMFRGASG